MATRKSARISAAAAGPATQKEPEEEAPAAPAQTGRKRNAPAAPAQGGRKKKAPAAAPAPEEESDGGAETTPPAPTTPSKRRAQAAVPPKTPTPSNAKLMGEPVANGTTPLPRPPAVSRLADPLATNATLLSPETSRVVASKPLDAAAVSPSKASTNGPKTTTANLLDEANAHLIRVDERMRPLVENNHCHIFSPAGLAEKIDPFESLCSGIISQQVSGAAAKAIKKRFIDLFDIAGARFPTPSQVAAKSIEQLRAAGLSQRKAEYVQGLAEKFASGELNAQELHDAPYDDLLERLLAVRGLGRWSVEMFACFGLKRMDVFSLGDLGVQRGMAAFEGRDVAKLKASKGGKWKYMSEKEMTEISNRFAPYRSLFMWYMWRVEETEISTLE